MASGSILRCISPTTCNGHRMKSTGEIRAKNKRASLRPLKSSQPMRRIVRVKAFVARADATPLLHRFVGGKGDCHVWEG
eukprot:3239332-Pleurochrysis_carterae.AAC.1